MMRTLLLASLLVCLLPARTNAAEPAAAPPERRVTLNFQDLPLRAALQQLF